MEITVFSDQLNKVEGFDPIKFVNTYTDPLTDETWIGLPIGVKKTWFRLVYPKGRLETKVERKDDLYIASTKLFTSFEDPYPIVETESYTLINRQSRHVAKMSEEEIIENYKLCAIGISEGKALSQAGFGIQFEKSNDLVENMIENPEVRNEGRVAETDKEGVNGKDAAEKNSSKKATSNKRGRKTKETANSTLENEAAEKDPLLSAIENGPKDNDYVPYVQETTDVKENVSKAEGILAAMESDVPEEQKQDNIEEAETKNTPDISEEASHEEQSDEMKIPADLLEESEEMRLEEARNVEVRGIAQYDGKTLGELFANKETEGVLPYIASGRNKRVPENIVNAAMIICGTSERAMGALNKYKAKG